MHWLLLAFLSFFSPRVSLFPQLGIFSGLRVDLRVYNNRCSPDPSVAASPIPAIRVICTREAEDSEIILTHSSPPRQIPDILQIVSCEGDHCIKHGVVQ